MWYNPIILTGDDLQSASTHDILVSAYQIIVASTLLFFSLLILYFVFKTILWFVPKYWSRKEV